MSKVAPVTAVLVIRCTASAAMSAGPTTRPDRQRRAELLAARVQLIAEERRRQRRVDEPGRDQVHPDRRELEREVPGQRRHRGCERRDQRDRRPAGGRRCRP